MKIVVLKEHMKDEGRVALTPDGCLQLTMLGHTVYIERGAGEKSGYRDSDYVRHGAEIVSTSSEIIPSLQSADTVVLKVKQPLPEDDAWLAFMKNCTFFAYFHSTGESDRRTIDILLKHNITAVSYENVKTNDGSYPLLTPMSKIAGRLAAEWGANLSQEARKRQGLSKAANRYLQMAVFGAGTVGFAAIKKALNLGFSRVIVFEKEFAKEHFLREHLNTEEMSRVKFFSSGDEGYESIKVNSLESADLLVGAVLVPGGHAPIVVSKEEVGRMSKGSVIVDVACDQGGCIEYPENENANIFEYEGKTFCRTPNMPGSVPMESTPILAKAIFPYLLEILDHGTRASLSKNVDLRKGLLTHNGQVMNEKAAIHWGEQYTDPNTVFDGS
jgi:alanine dehydrogenase